MKRFFLYLAVAWVALVAEGVIRHFPLVGVRVDCLWLLVLYLGFYCPLFPGGVLVFLIAASEEAAGVPIHGILSLSYLAVYLVLRMSYQHLFFERGASQVIWVLILTVLQRGVEQSLLSWQGYAGALDPVHLGASGLLSGFVSLPLFSFFQKGDKLFSRHAA